MTFDLRKYIIEQNDVKVEGIWSSIKSAILSGVNVVKDSNNCTGKIVSVNTKYATVKWEGGSTEKVGFYELERKNGAWYRKV